MNRNVMFLFLSFMVSSLFGGCSVSHSAINPIIRATFSKLIQSRYDNTCNYPKTIDEFVSYTEKHDSWKYQPIKDSLQTTLTFFKEERKNITWNFSYPTVTAMDLTILYYDDTIYRKADKLLFPGLDVSLYSYNWYHLEYPDSIEELIAYDSLSHCLHQGFFQCCDETFDYLLKNKDKIVWRKGDGDILIMASDDTIAFQGDDSQIQYCDDSVFSNKTVFRFFDVSGKYAYSEELEKNLKTRLTILREKYINASQEETNWHILEYYPEIGLRPFCKNDDIQLDTKWFQEIETLLCQFCSEYDLGKVVFVVPRIQ